jgi:hypothetical protein
MLRTETVERNLLELLKTLMQDEKLSDFDLVGGTNLALQIGHRMSIDLDLFSNKPFETTGLVEHLIKKYDMQTERVNEMNTIVGRINGVKVDMIAHIYPTLQNPFVDDGVRLYHLQDIVAMKLLAISDNGTRLKDFVDVAYLSTKMSLVEMVDMFATKYKNTSPIRAIKGLSYFDDIDFKEQIDLCNGKKFDWKKIEQRIREMIKFENKVFETKPV